MRTGSGSNTSCRLQKVFFSICFCFVLLSDFLERPFPFSRKTLKGMLYKALQVLCSKLNSFLTHGFQLGCFLIETSDY